MTDSLVHEATAIETTVRSAATGDEIAFARLVAEHHASMARVAYVVCGDPDATRDAVQSAWTIAWRKMRSLRDPSQVGAWLVTIAANEARQATRRQRRRPVTDISVELDAGGADPAESLDVMDLRRALMGLTAEDRTLLALRYAAGLDSYEIADQLRMSASGVRSRLARVIERLRIDLDATTENDR
jgi:RNA polymerase sigma-70 factor (ECF subfamily)